jgi:hypothetical protein
MNVTPEQLEAMQDAVRKREAALPAVGDAAPEFDLRRLGADGSVRLAEFRGKRPVALIFGSYT